MYRFERFFDEDREENETRIRHVVKPRINFNINLEGTIEDFRLSSTQIEFVLSKIGNNISHDSEWNNALTPFAAAVNNSALAWKWMSIPWNCENAWSP